MEPVIELDEQRLAVMKNLSLPLMVMTGDQNDYASLDILTALAKAELSQNFFVGVMWDPSFPNIHHKTTPSVTVFNSLDETTPRYGGRFDREGLLGFASLVSQPLVRQFDMSSLVSFMKSGLPIGMVYSTKEDERKALADVLSVVAMKHREDINFATVDATKSEFFLEPLGLQVDQLPAFVIQTDDRVFKFSPDMTITPEAIEDFIQRTLYSQTTPIAAQK
ncbi:hypothetical protein UA08_06857 [Talaromyces atroroseus]|uniref:Thioredoxin domain-containing protein n=1 Tax=Talaromyces atroroseus TaxID=1441469 RepID=A0A225ASQ4_TALAT|nr:hypothetical protein UA08_06857 [Talaromyces atroroseus]OKL57986.1 hypothetical protein UA08_06857 [Talaromyces atroroseus]